jgi:hypothetical protein
VAGLGLAKNPSDASAAGAAIPWPYPADPALQPAPEELARLSFEMHRYAGFSCAEATWWPFVNALGAAYPSTWGTLPRKMFQFGGQGVQGWGTLCGTLNATAAVVGMTVANGAHQKTLTDAVFQYYATTPLPTNDAWKSYQKVLGLTSGWAPTNPPLDNAPTSIADSPLCHSSLVQWTMTTDATNGGPLQKDRCAKACFDITYKLAMLLNAYFEAAAVPSVTLDPSVVACGKCHVTYTPAKMACSSCHDIDMTHAVKP